MDKTVYYRVVWFENEGRSRYLVSEDLNLLQHLLFDHASNHLFWKKLMPLEFINKRHLVEFVKFNDPEELLAWIEPCVITERGILPYET